MFDFNHVFKLDSSFSGAFNSEVTPILAKGEKILAVYKGARDGVVFTNLRMIALDVRGMIGSKYSAMSFPYESIKMFCIETAGFLDTDAMLSIWLSGMGCVRFAFSPRVDMNAVAKIIGDNVLPSVRGIVEEASSIPAKPPVMQCPKCARKYYNGVKTCFRCEVPLEISKDDK